MKLALGLVAAVGLLSMPAGAVFFDPDANSVLPNSQSIESETTFDLFENEYDRALMPALLAFSTSDGTWRIQGGNVGGTNQLQLMLDRPFGRGHGMVRYSHGTSKEEIVVSNFVESFEEAAGADDGSGTGDDDTFPFDPDIADDELKASLDTEEGNVTLGYGWQLGGGPVTQSLGFGVDYYWSEITFDARVGSFRIENTDDMSVDSENSTTDALARLASRTDQTALTFLAEWARRNTGGMNVWVRLFLQEIDYTVDDRFSVDGNGFAEPNDPVEGETRGEFNCPFDTPTGRGLGDDDEDIPEFCGFELSQEMRRVQRPYIATELIHGAADVASSRALSYGGIDLPSVGFLLGDVSHDGRRLGAQVRLDWGATGSPNRVEAGIAQGDFDTKNRAAGRESFHGVFTSGLFVATTDELYELPVLDDDISDASGHAKFSKWWIDNRFRVGGSVGLFWWEQETELTLGDELLQTMTVEFAGEELSTTTFRETASKLTRFEQELTTFSLSTGAEYDVTSRLTARFGARYLWSSTEKEWLTRYEQGSLEETEDGEVINVDLDRETQIDQAELSRDGTRAEINAGLGVDLGKLNLEILVAADDYREHGYAAGVDREGLGFDRIYLGFSLDR